jgi:hypothetical protein
MSGIIHGITDDGRAVTLRNGDGSAVFEIPILYGVTAGALAVLVAPRITAVAATAALVRGMSITVDDTGEVPAEA